MSQVPSQTAVVTTGLDLTIATLRSLVRVASQIVSEHGVGTRGKRAIDACNVVVVEIDALRVLFATPVAPVHISAINGRSGPDLDAMFGNEATRRLENDLKELIEEAARKLDDAGHGRKWDLETAARKYREPLPEETPLGVVELEFAYHGTGASDLKPFSLAFKESANLASEMLGTLVARNLYEALNAQPVPQPLPCLLGQPGNVLEQAPTTPPPALETEPHFGHGGVGPKHGD